MFLDTGPTLCIPTRGPLSRSCTAPGRRLCAGPSRRPPARPLWGLLEMQQHPAPRHDHFVGSCALQLEILVLEDSHYPCIMTG